MEKNKTTFYKKVKDLNKMCADKIAENLWHTVHGDCDVNVYDSEYQSWINSLPILISYLNEASLGDLDLIMEYTTPLSSRIDGILVGYDKCGSDRVLLIEDKQWSDENIKVGIDDTVVDIKIGQNFEQREHPLYQLHKYSNELSNHHSAFTNRKIDIRQLAFLHKMDNPLTLNGSDWKKDVNRKISKLIGKNDKKSFIHYVSSLFENKNNHVLTEEIINGSYILGEAGLDGLKKAIDSQENASMIKDQVDVNTFICNEIRRQIKKPHKEIIVVSGATGTGKTILGFHAIFAYHKILKESGHSTKTEDAQYSLARNRTLRTMIDNINGLQIPYVDNIPGNKGVKFVVIDEAHRIQDVEKTLNDLFKNKINFVIILQDDWQTISAKDNGTYKNFKKYANANGVCIKHKFLKSQLRTGINSNLTDIIDSMFSNNTKKAPHDFGLDIEDSLNEMNEKMEKYSKNGLTKWIAPYCWNWSKNTNKCDINIIDKRYTFSHPWNPYITSEQYGWLTNKDSLKEVASIYTIQGIDLDYAGCIWWDDLKWNSNQQKWIYDLNKCEDDGFKEDIKKKYSISITEANKEQKPEILRLFFNIYKVLLTRARKKTLIWFKDEDTKRYVSSFFDYN